MRSVTASCLAVVLTGVSFGLYSAMMGSFWYSVLRRRTAQPAPRGPLPKVSILKPLAGCDDDLAENLESFAGIEYPSFEVLLGVADTRDPAYRVARLFLARHPLLNARLVVTDPGA